MYAAVPRIVPNPVAPMVNVGEFPGFVPLGGLGSMALARPKSRILTTPSGVILNVGGLQVAMDDVLLVRGFDAVDQLLNDRQRVFEIERALEIFALDVLHDEVIGTNVIEMADVGVVERGDGAGFLREALGELLPGNLNGNLRRRRGS